MHLLKEKIIQDQKVTMFNNSSLVENEHEIPFYKHPAIEFTIYFVKITVLCLGILANLGVVLTVIFHSCPRKHAAFAAASLCASNIFYGLFILFYATPLRFSRTFQVGIFDTIMIEDA